MIYFSPLILLLWFLLSTDQFGFTNAFDDQSEVEVEVEVVEVEKTKDHQFSQTFQNNKNNIFREKRKQNESCTFDSQCESGYTCFRAITSSSCQPSYSTKCFNVAFDNIDQDTRDNLEKELSVYANYESLVENTKDTFEKISKEVGVLFLQDIFGFFNDFHRCAFDSPDFKLPKGIVRSEEYDGRLVRVQQQQQEEGEDGERFEVIHDTEILGMTLRLPKIDLGVAFSLGVGVLAGFGPSVNIVFGLMIDFDKIDFNKVDILNLNMNDVSSYLGETRLGAFTNLCLDGSLGLVTGFKVTGGLQYSNLVGTFRESIGVFAYVIPYLPGIFTYAENLPGTVNLCASYNVGVGAVGISNWFCGIGPLGLLFFDCKNYYFEIGGGIGPILGGAVSAGLCQLRTYTMDYGVGGIIDNIIVGPSSWDW